MIRTIHSVKLSLLMTVLQVRGHLSNFFKYLYVFAFVTGSNFTFSFSVSVIGNSLSITLGNNFLTTITLKHSLEDIRFLTLYGDIEKITQLNFAFG